MKTLITSIVLLLAAVSGNAMAQIPAGNVTFAYADVLRVDPYYETVRYSEPVQECYDQPVRRYERDGGDPTGGTVLGAIIGGALGNQLGKGDGRKAATVAGAVIGGAIGRSADRNDGSQRGREYRDVQRECRTVERYRDEQRIAGYDVEYQYRGDVFQSRLDYDPGSKLRVRVAVSPAD
ncbi:MAG: glycine zipper 2TM domain-containing protein [Xanthomonadales bacterium]|nr:glycine zipper 2TM domain-containing protein [Xanthomonadales bacterium]